MNIECGEYTLKSDSMNMWIEKNYISEKTGKEASKVVTGYCQDIEHLLKNFCERRFRGSEATSMKELLRDLHVIEDDLNALAASLGKKLEGVKL